MVANLFFGGHDLMSQLFILGQIANKLQDQFAVIRGRLANQEFRNVGVQAD